ncbi:hypothetical protein D0T84_08230 [Dysgonomonas sp. 521]|uniref:hypothetical protein n=1 Tax=Dysgonomonas sp. 521 TaxID=2302932 RepID=UPI0013D0F56C|nr:hypothetical protein [Dysgonomonas sp. 521]NDV94903.1 hypothetical protein [Dysgonomonas sp. 521]
MKTTKTQNKLARSKPLWRQAIAFLAFLVLTPGIYAQVTIGSDKEPESFSVLELISNKETGLRMPHLTTIQRNDITTPAFKAKAEAKGLTIYNTTIGCLEFWNGTEWISACEPSCTAPVIEPLEDTEKRYVIWNPYMPAGTMDLSKPVVPAPAPTLSISATGTSLTYQWYYRNYNSEKKFLPVYGATSDTYQVKFEKLGLYQYKCVVSEADNPSCSAESDTIEVVWGCGAKTYDDRWLVFMCHNLGADPSLDPFTWKSDGDEVGFDIKGDLYQWGRKADGHEKRTSPVVDEIASVADLDGENQVKVTSDKYGKFIAGTNFSSWTVGFDPILLNWGDGTILMDVPKAKNDPCPEGWKVPSLLQWQSIVRGPETAFGTIISLIPTPPVLVNKWTWTGNGVEIGDALYLPAATTRSGNNGKFSTGGYGSTYWSSNNWKYPGRAANVFGTFGFISLASIYPADHYYYPVNGFPIRCIQE